MLDGGPVGQDFNNEQLLKELIAYIEYDKLPERLKKQIDVIDYMKTMSDENNS